MKFHYPKSYNMAHLLALNVLLLPKDLTIILIYCIGGNFNIHIWAWLASPSVQVGRLEKS